VTPATVTASHVALAGTYVAMTAGGVICADRKNGSDPNSPVENHPSAAITIPCFIFGAGASLYRVRATVPVEPVNTAAMTNAAAG